MKMNLSAEVISRLQGKKLATAESLTGGGIGEILTSVPGASRVYAGGIISYTNEIKHKLLGVSEELLQQYGAVSAAVAQEMASGAIKALNADVSVAVTGLAGPDGDEHGHRVGTVFIGYADSHGCFSQEFHFTGDRTQVRNQTVEKALQLILEENT